MDGYTFDDEDNIAYRIVNQASTTVLVVASANLVDFLFRFLPTHHKTNLQILRCPCPSTHTTTLMLHQMVTPKTLPITLFLFTKPQNNIYGRTTHFKVLVNH